MTELGDGLREQYLRRLKSEEFIELSKLQQDMFLEMRRFGKLVSKRLGLVGGSDETDRILRFPWTNYMVKGSHGHLIDQINQYNQTLAQYLDRNTLPFPDFPTIGAVSGRTLDNENGFELPLGEFSQLDPRIIDSFGEKLSDWVFKTRTYDPLRLIRIKNVQFGSTKISPFYYKISQPQDFKEDSNQRCGFCNNETKGKRVVKRDFIFPFHVEYIPFCGSEVCCENAHGYNTLQHNIQSRRDERNERLVSNILNTPAGQEFKEFAEKTFREATNGGLDKKVAEIFDVKIEDEHPKHP